MKKRLLSALLCLCMAVGMLPAITMTVQAAGTGVADRLNQLRNDYPDKQYWYRVNGVNKVTTTPCPHRDYRTDCGSYNGGWQCWAFASKIFYDIFKQNPNVFGDQRKDKENIRVGDYVRFSWPSDKTYGHSFVVLSISGSIVTAVECNTEEGNCRIRWDRGKYDLNSGMLAYDPYGKLTNYYFDYYCRATNYDEVNISSSVNLDNDFYAYINYDTTNYRLENHSNGNVQLAFKDNNDPRQLWHFTWQGNSYKISSVYNTNCLDAAGAGNTEGTNVHAYLDNGNIQQRWIISKDIDGKSNTYNLLTAYNSNLAVDVVASVAQNGQNVTLWSRNHNQAQKFWIQKVSLNSLGGTIPCNLGSDFYARISYNGAYLQTTGSITTVSDGRGMDVRLTRTSSTTDKRQIWHFIRQPNGSYKIINEFIGWCLDVEGGVVEPHKAKNVWTWHNDYGDSPERWYIVYSPGDSAYRIVSAIAYPGALYSLDIPGGGTGENANVELFEQNSNAWQYFNITKLSSYPPQTHTHSYTSRVTSPTCMTGGYTTYTCSGCGYSYTGSYTDPLGHYFSIVETTDPTCTAMGYSTRYCSRCHDGYIESRVDALGHSYIADVTAPTCTERGYTTYTCSRCDNSYVDNYTDARNHSYSTEVTAATCTERGSTTHTCSRCGDSYIDSYTDALGHSYGEWTTTKPATSTETGQRERTCSRCGNKETEVIPVSTGCEHSYDSVVTAPTCTERGYTTHTCGKCGNSYVDSYVNASGHQYAETITAPTCTNRGYTTYLCSRCNHSYTGSYVNASGHSYSDTIIAPSCTERGYTVYTCSKCGDSYTGNYTDMLSHNYITSSTAPTCTERGYTVRICSQCGNSYVDNYTDALGHSYGKWIITTPATATASGTEMRTCAICNDVQTQDIPATDFAECTHDYTDEVTAPTCTEQGYITHTCSQCGDSYMDTYTAALGHSYGEWAITVQATANTDGRRERSCSRCGDKQTSVIPATGGSSGNTPGHSSGDSSDPIYRIEAPAKITGGTLKITPASANVGQRVTITVKPDSGYNLEKLTITDDKGNDLALTDNGADKYTFTMPKGKVTVNAAFQPIEKPWDNHFQDITADMWYYDAVKFVNENGLMNGVSNDMFAPNSNLSRAQLAQILYNQEGRPTTKRSPFADVSDEAWYGDAVAWAAEKGIVSGYGNGLFGPGDSITREQLAVMLWRYAGSPTPINKELHFNDTGEISSYALESLCWATENGIISGYGSGKLSPNGEATRAQVAQMLMNYLKK